jgi:hypothetical protein
MITERKVGLIREYFHTIDDLVAPHPLDTLAAFVRGLITAWSLDGTISWWDAEGLKQELEQLTEKVRKRFENNEG